MLKLLFSVISSYLGYFKKAMLVILVFLGVIFLFLHVIQGNRISLQNEKILEENRKSIYSTIKQYEKDDSQFSKNTLFIYRALMCRMMGEACTDNPADAKKNFEYSWIAGISNLIALPYSHIPASGLAWVQNGLENAGFVPQTYAAEGIGFSSIKGYITIWKLFRDLAFMLLVLFMVILGFLIMFRVKLDGQTAVAIEAILPRIVITMLLITFSFAIVGFLIDFMYSIILIGTSIIFKLEPLKAGLEAQGKNIDEMQKNYLVASGRFLWPDSLNVVPFQRNGVFALGQELYNVLPNTFRFITQSLLSVLIGVGVTQAASKWFDKGLIEPLKGMGFQAATFGVQFGNAPAWLGLLWQIPLFVLFSFYLPGLVLGVIILLTVLMFIFRLFFMLLSSYLKLIIYLIFAPIIILFNVFPGNNAFSWWFKSVLGELSVFPTVILISLIGQAIINVNVGANNDFRLPFLYGIDASSFTYLVATGIVLLTPDFIKVVKKTIGAEDAPFDFGIGTFLAGAGLVTAAGGLHGNITNWRRMLVGHNPMEQSYGLFGLGKSKWGQLLRESKDSVAKKPEWL